LGYVANQKAGWSEKEKFAAFPRHIFSYAGIGVDIKRQNMKNLLEMPVGGPRYELGTWRIEGRWLWLEQT
jgi:hypothetical protein